MIPAYADYLHGREQLANAGGFEPVDLPEHLFDFQWHLVEWAVRQGRAALFADCGLGKTPMSLAWAEQVHRHTGKPVLILTPLAVGFQVVEEAARFGHDAAQSRDGVLRAPLVVTNYEQLSKFDPDDFAGVVCDESSILKSFDGVTKAAVTEFMRRIPYRLLGTATAAPNDYIELGTSSEALGGMGYMDTLTRFFINDARSVSSRGRTAGGKSIEWRLKNHAEQPFWRWVSSWARAIRKPSDYGFDDGRFHLPSLITDLNIVHASDGIAHPPATNFAEEREENRRTLTERCERAAEVLADADSAVAWCNLNDESSALARLIPGAVELSGSDSSEAKEEKLRAFTHGEFRVLVTKPKIGAWGLNWQHCHRMSYFPTHSYESYYQAVRRSWRFGQQHDVTIHVVSAESGDRVLSNLQRKATQADGMFDALIQHMNDALDIKPDTYTKIMEVPSWAY